MDDSREASGRGEGGGERREVDVEVLAQRRKKGWLIRFVPQVVRRCDVATCKMQGARCNRRSAVWSVDSSRAGKCSGREGWKLDRRAQRQ